VHCLTFNFVSTIHISWDRLCSFSTMFTPGSASSKRLRHQIFLLCKKKTDVQQ
jgi:hypothetical protein